VATRRTILVVGQAHRECAGLRFQDAPTVGRASGFACEHQSSRAPVLGKSELAAGLMIRQSSSRDGPADLLCLGRLAAVSLE